jgi:hypothetical protein
MANRKLKFGDIVRDHDKNRLLAAVSTAQHFKIKKFYVTFIEVTDDHHCLTGLKIPLDRLTVKDMQFVDNKNQHIENYLIAEQVQYDAKHVNELAFICKQ